MTEWLIGSESALENLNDQPTGTPFDEERIGFVHAFSQRILTDAGARHFPEIMAMAHWFRKAHLLELRKRYASGHAARKPRGTVFHIAPGNVDTVSMYSWLLSLMLGNRNILRLSQQRGPQMDVLLVYLSEALSGFPSLERQNLIGTYGHDDAVTKRLSALCDLRVTWGGDETVTHVQSLALPAGAEDLGFPDRFSMAALDAAAVAALDEDGWCILVSNFYNDAMWFDQRACASPKLVIWTGDESSIASARRHFWPRFTEYVTRKGLPSCASLTIPRATTLMQWAAKDWLAEDMTDMAAFPAHVLLRTIPEEIRTSHPGLGLFGEAAFERLDDLAPLTTPKDQCLATFGFPPQIVADFAMKAHFTRTPPIGRALEFDVEWDGVCLFDAFTSA